MPSSWLEVSVRTHPLAMDAVANFLTEQGSPGVVIESNQVRAYFSGDHEFSAVLRDARLFLRRISTIFPEARANRLRWRILKDRNWNSAWRRFFSAQKVGRKFLIVPPWEAPPRPGGRELITIEPGMAFGTGTHATTRGCLEFIEQVDSRLPCAGYTALDVGTGSGILAIALAKLHATKVCALDNDPVALQAARENLDRNEVGDKIQLSSVSPDRLRKTFSVVVANLTAETIRELASALAKRVAPSGFLILSGILKRQTDSLLLNAHLSRFRLISQKGDKEWMTLLLKRK